MKKIKVLQYTGAMNRGGAETLLMNIYRNLDRSKFEFHFITHQSEKSSYDDEIIRLGGKVIYLQPANLKNLNTFKKDFKNIIKEHGPYDAIHSHTQLFNGIILGQAKKNKINIRISHAHSNGDHKNRNIFRIIYIQISKFLIKKYSTHKLCCSNKSGEYLYGDKKFILLNNAIDIEQFSFEQKNKYIHELLSIDKRCKIITHIGTFKYVKNHNFIIDIFKEMSQKYEDYRLVLVGNGELQFDIKKKVKELNLKDKVYFMGSRSDIPQILQSTDVLFMPSIMEGLPVALIEAQSAGVPCIISDNIPSQCDMNLNLVRRISLNENENIWIEALVEGSNKNKEDFKTRKECIIKSGYDLNKNIEFLTSIYSLYCK